MRLADCMEIIEKRMPKDLALGWDNVGLLVGNPEKEVGRVYVALDVTDSVVEHAIEAKADLLLTHHPLIFSGMKRVVTTDFIGKRVIDMIRADMSYYAMHTNFDVAVMGELASEYLGLENTKTLDVTCSETDMGIGCVGELSQAMNLKGLAELCKLRFGISSVKVFGEEAQKVKRIAISPGSGKSEVQEALRAEADVLITGDIDHHTGIDAFAQGLAIIDAGHYGIEHIYIAYMKEFLQDVLPELEVVTETKKEPFWVI